MPEATIDADVSITDVGGAPEATGSMKNIRYQENSRACISVFVTAEGPRTDRVIDTRDSLADKICVCSTAIFVSKTMHQ